LKKESVEIGCNFHGFKLVHMGIVPLIMLVGIRHITLEIPAGGSYNMNKR